MPNKKIGFIGYRGHTSRLIKIFAQMGRCEISHFFHPEKDIDLGQIYATDPSKLIATRSLKDLYACDGIVISTPNHTHFTYIKKLAEDYSGYIFCEKPPVSNLAELEKLESFSARDKKRIYFNFNMRFSFLNEMLRMFPKKYNLGEPVRAAIIAGHGLAFKESYKPSWRAKKEFHEAGVLETLGIHFFDLFSSLFGPAKDVCYNAENYSPYGDSVDTCHLSCSFENKCYFSLTCSYCIPFAQNIQVNYTNGSINYDAGKIKVFGPRETFDKNGSFIHPPLIYEKDMDKNSLYLESLRNSCQYFLDCICNKQEIDLDYFEQSILSNRMCLGLHNQIRQQVKGGR